MADRVFTDKHSLVDYLREVKYDLKQNMIISGEIPSLKYMTLLRMTILLWNDKLGRGELSVIRNFNVYQKMKVYQTEIITTISQLNKISDFKVPLERLINSTREEIEKYFEQFYFFTRLNEYEIFWKNVCWTQQGTINKHKSAINIINNSNLSTLQKYFIACNNCLEEKIINLLEMLPEDCINNYIYGPKPNQLVLFWTFYVKGEYEKFFLIGKSSNVRGVIITYSISNNVESAVQYIWENFFDDKMKKERLMYLVNLTGYSERLNICFYLFQQMNKVQLKRMNFEMSYCLLKELYNISIWSKVEFVISVPKLCIGMHAVDSFKILLNCWKNKFIDMEEYKFLWKICAKKFRSFLEKKFKELFENLYDITFKEIPDPVTIELLLSMGTPVVKRDLIYSEMGIFACILMLRYRGKKFFDNFIDQMLEDVEEVTKFKNTFFVNNIMDIYNGLIASEHYLFFEELYFKLCYEGDIKKFKIELAYKSDAYIITRIYEHVELTQNDFLKAINKFLSWCFDGDDEEIATYKAFVFDLDKKPFNHAVNVFVKKHSELIRNMDFTMLEEYWKFIYYATKDHMSTSNEKLQRINKIFDVLLPTEDILNVRIPFEIGLLKKFITFCFKQDEVEELKQELMDSEDLRDIVVLHLLKYMQHEEIDEFLDWCCPSDKDTMDEFKSSVMLMVLVELIEDKIDKRKLMFTFKWFNPTIESATFLKDDFLSVKVNNRISNFQMSIQNGEDLSEIEHEWIRTKKKMNICFQLLTEILNEKYNSKEKKSIHNVNQDFDNIKKVENKLKLIKQNFCFEQYEINEPKKRLIENTELQNRVANMLKFEKFQEIDILVNEYFSSDKAKIDDFKLTVMLSLLMEMIKINIKTPKLKVLYKWFNPTANSANLLKYYLLILLADIWRQQLNVLKENGGNIREKEREWSLITKRKNQYMEILDEVVNENTQKKEKKSQCDNKNNNQDDELVVIHLRIMVKEMVELERYEEIDELLDWWYSFEQEDIDKLKSDVVYLFLINFIKCDIDEPKLKDLYRWLNPTVELANSLKDNCVAFMANTQNINSGEDFCEQMESDLKRKTNICLQVLEEFVSENNSF